MTAISSLVKNVKFQFKLYNYSFLNEPSYYDSLKEKYHEIRVNKISNNQDIKSVNLNDIIKIENLDIGMYLLEVTLIGNNSLCDGINMCIDESEFNNQIKCIQCSKLVVHFVLEQNMLNNNNDEIDNNKINNTNKVIVFNKIKVTNLKKDVIFKCSIDNQISLTSRKFRLFNRKNFVKYDVYSLVLPFNFSLSDLAMPYFKINIPAKNDYLSALIITIIVFVSCSFFILALLIIVFVIVFLAKYNHQCIFFLFIFAINFSII